MKYLILFIIVLLSITVYSNGNPADGDKLMEESNFSEAIVIYKSRLKKEQKESAEYFEISLKLSKALMLNNEFLETKKIIVDIQKKTKNKKQYLQSQLIEAELNRKRNKYLQGFEVLHSIKLSEKDSIYYLEIIINKHQRLSAYYNETQNRDLAFSFSFLALKEIESQGEKFKDLKASTYNELGNLFEQNKEFEKAKKYYLKALKTYVDNKNLRYEVSVSENYARILMAQNKLDSAIYITKKIISQIRNRNWIRLEYANYLNLSTCYFAKKDSLMAYKYLDSFRVSQDMLVKINNDEKLVEFETRYLSLENTLKLKDVELENAGIKKENKFYVSFLILIVVLLIFVLVSFIILFRNRKKINELYKKEFKQKVEIETLLKSKDFLLSETHHRIKNNLQLIVSLIELNKRNKTPNSSEELKLKINAILELNKMLNFKDLSSTIDLKKYFNSLNSNLITLNIKRTIRFDLDIQLVELDSSNATYLGLIYSELVINSIKHAKTGNELKITFTLVKIHGKIIFNYADNGTEVEIKPNETSKGLHLIQLLAKQLKGKSEIDTQNGFSFKLTF